MRLVAAEILRIVKRKAPSLFQDFEIGTLTDGSPIVVHEIIR
jgi:thymidylate synthase ThyX